MRGTLIPRGTLTLLIYAILRVSAAVADDPHMTEAEAAALPAYCLIYNQHGNIFPELTKDPELAAQIATYRRTGCSGYHHYCWALAWANRGYFPNESETRPTEFLFSVAVSNIDYVMKNSKPTCSLIPEMQTRAGEWEGLRGRFKEAQGRYGQAISIKPSYAPAYVGLSDLFESLGKNDEAIAAVQAGIKANPGSTALKKKLARLQTRLTGQGATP